MLLLIRLRCNLLFGVSGVVEERKTISLNCHISFVSFLAPLLMSNDLRNIQPEFKSILLNERLIAINQDPFGIMGKLVNTVRLCVLDINKFIKKVGSIEDWQCENLCQAGDSSF